MLTNNSFSWRYFLWDISHGRMDLVFLKVFGFKEAEEAVMTG
jgi:hypothetical protein